MDKCREIGCSAPPRYLLRLRKEGKVHIEARLCVGHYNAAIVLINQLAPDAEHTISGYESEQSKTVH